jgi:hypothetical protein
LHTVLINDFVRRRFPLLLVKDLYNDNITLNRPIHVFAADKKDRFGEGWYRDGTLT